MMIVDIIDKLIYLDVWDIHKNFVILIIINVLD